MSMFVDFAKRAGRLVGIGSGNRPPTVKEIRDNFVQLPYEAAKHTRGVKKDTNGIVTKEFKGVIENPLSNLNGRYLHSLVKKLNNYTVVLTGIHYREDLGQKFDNKSHSERGECELSSEDFPPSDELIGGYHLLLISGNEKAATQVNKLPDEMKLLEKIADVVLQKSVELSSPSQVISWLKEDSDYRLYGGNPKGCFIFGSS